MPEIKALAERIRALESDVRVLKWMSGTNIRLTLIVLGKLLVFT